MKKPETRFKDDIVRPALRKLRNALFEKIQQVTKRGTPDFLGVVSSYGVALELKKDEHARPDPLQTYFLDRFDSMGKGLTFVAHPGNWDRIYSLLVLLDAGRVTAQDVKRMKEYGELQ